MATWGIMEDVKIEKPALKDKFADLKLKLMTVDPSTMFFMDYAVFAALIFVLELAH